MGMSYKQAHINEDGCDFTLAIQGMAIGVPKTMPN